MTVCCHRYSGRLPWIYRNYRLGYPQAWYPHRFWREHVLSPWAWCQMRALILTLLVKSDILQHVLKHSGYDSSRLLYECVTQVRQAVPQVSLCFGATAVTLWRGKPAQKTNSLSIICRLRRWPTYARVQMQNHSVIFCSFRKHASRQTQSLRCKITQDNRKVYFVKYTLRCKMTQNNPHSEVVLMCIKFHLGPRFFVFALALPDMFHKV